MWFIRLPMEKRNKNLLYIQEKKLVGEDKVIILSRKTNSLIWYFLLLILIIVSTFEFFKISFTKNTFSFILNVIIVIILVFISFFIFSYNRIKFKIVKSESGEIFIEKLKSLLINEEIIKPSGKAYLYSKLNKDGKYGLEIRYKDIKSKKLTELSLLPYYKSEMNNPLFLIKEDIEKIGEFLDIKIIFE
jgi:hypothetical protein